MVNSEKKEFALVIPSLNPDQRFLNFILSLKSEFQTHPEFEIHIIVVNDGTSEEHLHFFDDAHDIYPFTLLHHATNLGKGRAIKTAINHILLVFPDICGVLLADCDGQHLAEDSFTCLKASYKYPESLILGVRDFHDKIVPRKNKYGNLLTRKIFHFLCGIKVSDSQTGLRVLPNQFLRSLMNVQGERFEFEMYMLLATRDYQIPIHEQSITTVYEKENYTTHFNPIKDSIRIYSIFLKFIFSGLSSFVLDALLFILFINLFDSWDSYIIIATILARFFSSIYNYFMNQKVVFKANNGLLGLLKYFSLVIVQAFISGFCVTYLYKQISAPELFLKIPVDLILFLFSFYIQQTWIFKKKKSL